MTEHKGKKPEEQKRFVGAVPHLSKPPKEGPAPGLLSQSGPVILGEGRRGVLTLGGIQSGKSTSHPVMPVSPPPSSRDEPVRESQPVETVTQMAPVAFKPPTVPSYESVQTHQYEVPSYGPTSIASPATSWSPSVLRPQIDPAAFVHQTATVEGNVIVGPDVFIGAGAIIRGDNEEPIYIGDGSNIQEGVVIRDLPTSRDGKSDNKRLVDVDGRKYTVYIGKRVSICPQAQIHGPARVEDSAYIGMKSLIFWARVGRAVVVEPDCLVMNVSITSAVFVPAGLKVTNQKTVGELPPMTSQYRFYGIGEEVSRDFRELAKAHLTAGQ